MFRKIVAVITLICFIVTMQGCYSLHKSSTHKRAFSYMEEHPEKYTIAKLVTTDGEVIEFETAKDKRAVVTEGAIEGVEKYFGFRSIPLSEVKTVYIRKLDPLKITLLVIGVSALAVLTAVIIVLATKESCPFVYSFDGEQYVFDGEPYGGAICQALQRTDWCRLEHLQPVNGEYRLLLTNEVNETQHTDEFKLWIVDHPSGVEVIPDSKGNLYSIDSHEKLLSAVDSRGQSCHKWLSENDLLFWESNVLSKDPDNPSDLRDTLFLDFPKPADVERAKLVVNGCNTLWGSQMLRRMMEVRGNQVQSWYQGLKTPALMEQLEAWLVQEEIYHLQVYLWANGEWVRRGEILGGGPFVAEERAVPLDLENVEGNSLKIRIAPPVGFWQLNFFAIDYSEDLPLEVQEISASLITQHDGVDLRPVLESTDSNYYVMPEVGQRATLTFPVLPMRPGLERTVFAKVSGYYDMHLDSTGPSQIDVVTRIDSEPGYVTKFALQEYLKWRKEQLAESEK